MEDFDDVIGERTTGFASATRALLGLFLLGFAIATFFVGQFRVSFMAQLTAAHFPFEGLTMVVIPTIAGVAGSMLLGGFMVRLASLVSLLLCLLLTFLHIVVTSPTVIPLQFGLPLIPIVALVLSGFLFTVEQYEENV